MKLIAGGIILIIMIMLIVVKLSDLEEKIRTLENQQRLTYKYILSYNSRLNRLEQWKVELGQLATLELEKDRKAKKERR